MKNLSIVFLLCMLCTATFQAQNYPPNYQRDYSSNYGTEDEPEKCYAQCLIPGDTLSTTDTIEIKPACIIPTVQEGYPSTEQVTYMIKEECTTCNFEVEKTSLDVVDIVVVKPGYWEYITTPCVYETVTDSILVREGSVKYEVTPPSFEQGIISIPTGGVIEEGICTPAKTKKEKRTVEIEEECVKIEVSDYIWEDETFEIEVSQPTKKWVKEKSDNNCLSTDPEDCMVWRLVQVPGEKQSCTRKVKKGCPYGYEDNGEYCIKRTTTPAKTKEYTVELCVEEAKFEKITLAVDEFLEIPFTNVKDSATYTVTEIDPIYEVIEREVLVQAAKIDSIYHPPVEDTVSYTIENQFVVGKITKTPAVEESCDKTLCVEPTVTTTRSEPEYKIFTKIEVQTGSFSELREVLCSDNINGYMIREIHSALESKGYKTGDKADEIDAQTKATLIQFQKANNLPIGQLDLKTLEALGINR